MRRFQCEQQHMLPKLRKPILTQTSNAKCFMGIILINKRGLAEIIVPFRGYGRHSPNQVMIKRE